MTVKAFYKRLDEYSIIVEPYAPTGEYTARYVELAHTLTGIASTQSGAVMELQNIAAFCFYDPKLQLPMPQKNSNDTT